jgi:hypothetical protein
MKVIPKREQKERRRKNKIRITWLEVLLLNRKYSRSFILEKEK